MTFSELISHVLYGDYKNYEPEKSTRLRSVRELKYGPHHIGHRFPIKGGVSFRAVVIGNITENNALLQKLKMKGKVK